MAYRGHHHRPQQGFRAVRHRSQHQLRLQGHVSPTPAGSVGPGRQLHIGRQRPEGWAVRKCSNRSMAERRPPCMDRDRTLRTFLRSVTKLPIRSWSSSRSGCCPKKERRSHRPRPPTSRPIPITSRPGSFSTTGRAIRRSLPGLRLPRRSRSIRSMPGLRRRLGQLRLPPGRLVQRSATRGHSRNSGKGDRPRLCSAEAHAARGSALANTGRRADARGSV